MSLGVSTVPLAAVKEQSGLLVQRLAKQGSIGVGPSATAVITHNTILINTPS